MRAVRSAVLAFALALGALPATTVTSEAAVSIGISVGIAPPPLPVYAQPAIPGPGYHWIPGYWAWDADADDYYWVPGYWSRPPRVGLLWTPGYWGWSNGAYVFNTGYWGPRVGYYGGIAYGFGYSGSGFDGGYWRGGSYFYNRSVTNVSVNITNVYNRPVMIAPSAGRVSYNGGQGGIVARPEPGQIVGARDRIAPTIGQRSHVTAAARNQALRAKANHGTPPVTAVSRPGAGVGGKPTLGRPGLTGRPAVGGRPGAGHALPGRTGPGAGATGPAVKRVGPAVQPVRPARQKPGVQRPAVQRPALQRPSVQQRPALQRPAVQQRPALQRPTLQRPAVQQRPAAVRPVQRPVMRQAPPRSPAVRQQVPAHLQRRLPPQ